MTTPALGHRGAARLASLIGAALVAGGICLATATPADAAGAQVSYSPDTLDPEYATTLTLHGSGFQSVQNGFGGVYVLFGWVDGNWRPSQGGTSGVNYVYVQDSETKDNHGYEKFVAFPGDPTAYAANGGQVNPDGTWDTTLVVPGATFPAQGRDGGVQQVDCQTVQCGIITIGAHGVVNTSNETFTPVTFAEPVAAAPTTEQAAPTTEQAPATTEQPTPTTEQAAPVIPTTTSEVSPVETTVAAPEPVSSAPAPIAPAPSISPSTTPSAASSSAPRPSASASASVPVVPAAADSDSGSGSSAWPAVVGGSAVVVVGAAGGGVWWWRRRSALPDLATPPADQT